MTYATTDNLLPIEPIEFSLGVVDDLPPAPKAKTAKSKTLPKPSAK